MLSLPILRPQLLVEATSLGTAIAGGVGVGFYPNYAMVANPVRLDQGKQPRPEVARRYDALLYSLFTDAYEALRPVFYRL